MKYEVKNSNIKSTPPFKKTSEEFINLAKVYKLVSNQKTTVAESTIFSNALTSSDLKVALNDVCVAIVDGYYKENKTKHEGVGLGAIKMNNTPISNETYTIAQEISKLDFVESVYIFVLEHEIEFWTIVTEKNAANRKEIFKIASSCKNVIPIVLTNNQLDKDNMPLYNLCIFNN